jgi:hypothetical protein
MSPALPDEAPGKAGVMSDPSGSEPSGAGAESREIAERLAQEIAPMVKQARLAGFDFLAYLLGMALKESRRLAQGDNER